MKEDPKTLTPFKTTRASGGVRATLALVFSLLAFVTSGFVLYENMMQDEGPARPAPDATAALHTRIRAIETGASSLNENMAALKADVAKLAEDMKARPATETPAVASPETARNLQDIETRLQAITAEARGIELRVKSDLALQSGKMATFALLQTIDGKMRDGIRFERDLKIVERNLGRSGPLQVLNAYAVGKPVSDAVLQTELRQLSNEILAKEKMDQADGIVDKVGIQLQKLVTIRPKDGAKVEGSATATRIAQLQQAIEEQVWDDALQQAEALKDIGPKDYAAWLQKLRTRVEAERALADLHATIVPPPVEPVPTAPAPEVPAASPAPQPATKP
jgi:hypothetical protein